MIFEKELGPCAIYGISQIALLVHLLHLLLSFRRVPTKYRSVRYDMFTALIFMVCASEASNWSKLHCITRIVLSLSHRGISKEVTMICRIALLGCAILRVALNEWPFTLDLLLKNILG